jgi:hypothetical protein
VQCPGQQIIVRSHTSVVYDIPKLIKNGSAFLYAGNLLYNILLPGLANMPKTKHYLRLWPDHPAHIIVAMSTISLHAGDHVSKGTGYKKFRNVGHLSTLISAWALLTMKADGSQEGHTLWTFSRRLHRTGNKSFSFALEITKNATGIPFRHSSKTIRVYRGYCNDKNVRSEGSKIEDSANQYILK